MSSTRWLVGTVVLVVAVAIVAVVVTTVREPRTYPADTPEGVVQRYLQAVADGDRDAALDLYAPQIRQRCEDEDLGPRPFPEERRSFDADLLGRERVDADTVDVRVRITEFSGEPPFDSGSYDHTEVYRVTEADGNWGLTDVSWPYYVCPG